MHGVRNITQMHICYLISLSECLFNHLLAFSQWLRLYSIERQEQTPLPLQHPSWCTLVIKCTPWSKKGHTSANAAITVWQGRVLAQSRRYGYTEQPITFQKCQLAVGDMNCPTSLVRTKEIHENLSQKTISGSRPESKHPERHTMHHKIRRPSCVTTPHQEVLIDLRI
jgi:hypothetical protein